MSWQKFFRAIDQELVAMSKVFWTMTSGREHRIQWVCRRGRWGMTSPQIPEKSQKVSVLSCIHRIPDRKKFWKDVYQKLADGGRVHVWTQGCQAIYPVPPRLAGHIPDAPSVGEVYGEMAQAGLSSCIAAVHIIERKVPRPTWEDWLLEGCLSDADYCDPQEIKGYCQTLPPEVQVRMAYYLLVGIKLGPQSGLVDIRPSGVHGLSACARQPLPRDWVLLAVPHKASPRNQGTRHAEWHHRPGQIGLHLCSTVYRLFNHSSDPNCVLTPEGLVKTARDIASGEELTLDYAAAPNVKNCQLG